jgi:acyl carrier protein
MSGLVARFGRDLPRLAGVFHAAADLSLVPVSELTAPAIERMFKPKVAGALVIDVVTRTLDLDIAVLFSSTTALWGAAGLAHYAAANAVLDRLAHARRAEGRPFLSVNWGTWDVMRLASDTQRATFAAAGLRPLPSDEATALLDRAIVSGLPNVAIASVDWPALKAVYEARRRRPLFEHVGAASEPLAASTPATSALRGRLETLDAEQREALLVDVVSREVAGVLGAEPGTRIDPARGLFEMGMDSLMSVELKTRLERAVGAPLPSTLTFNYPNVGALARFIATEVLPPPAVPAAPADPDDDGLTAEALAQMLAARLEELR